MGIYIDDLLGIPYKVGGRNKQGFDCYGLTIEVLRRFGFNMSDLFFDYTKKEMDELIANNYELVVKKDSLIKKTKAEEGDILLFYDKKGRACHIGVYLSRGRFIHCDGLGVRITCLSSYYRDSEVYGWHE
jgi:cell wall-associated NlpC family hydrolase